MREKAVQIHEWTGPNECTKSMLLAIHDGTLTLELIAPIVDMHIAILPYDAERDVGAQAFSKEVLDSSKNIVSLFLPLEIPYPLMKTCNVQVLYTDDPSAETAYDWMSLGCSRVSLLLKAFDVIVTQQGIIFKGFESDFLPSIINPER